MRRISSIVLAGMVLVGLPFAARAATSTSCTPRLLVLSAFPAELGKILSAADFETTPPVKSDDGREFYVRTLEGKPVIMALTGIGPVNARTTTQDAFATFDPNGLGCISGVVFSGVAGAGGGSRIGDVTVPDQWTQDNGTTWVPTNRRMRQTAKAVAPTVKLEQTTPLGDPACACVDPDAVQTVTFPYVPQVRLHGNGSTTDPFGGHAAPCLQHGGDLAGCEPCPASLHALPDPGRFVTGMEGIADPGFFLGIFAPAPAPPSGVTYVAADEETAAAGQIAKDHATPFIAFRAISDGTADPLMLPGFPAQFFVYKQLAADNAAAMTLAFVRAWT
ncbi:MAG: 5'-methylthioadenosine/S-adenosylhomocysteine nucleosidase [Actinobacteria bacterium]|nr:MAG: 5'-methylthioadenosine/S-adenosylhomocysteine nucleosidase [Actinomycetota bacterium]